MPKNRTVISENSSLLSIFFSVSKIHVTVPRVILLSVLSTVVASVATTLVYVNNAQKNMTLMYCPREMYWNPTFSGQMSDHGVPKCEVIAAEDEQSQNHSVFFLLTAGLHEFPMVFCIVLYAMCACRMAVDRYKAKKQLGAGK